MSTDLIYSFILYSVWKCDAKTYANEKCKTLWTYKINHNCYYLSKETTLSWQNSKEICRLDGGHLLSINSYEEYMNVIALTRKCTEERMNTTFFKERLTTMEELWHSAFVFIGLYNFHDRRNEVIRAFPHFFMQIRNSR